MFKKLVILLLLDFVLMILSINFGNFDFISYIFGAFFGILEVHILNDDEVRW